MKKRYVLFVLVLMAVLSSFAGAIDEKPKSGKKKKSEKATTSKSTKKGKEVVLKTSSRKEKPGIKEVTNKKTSKAKEKTRVSKPLIKKTASNIPVAVKPFSGKPTYKQPAMGRNPFVILDYAKMDERPNAILDLVCSQGGWIYIRITLNVFEAVFPTDFGDMLKERLDLKDVILSAATETGSANASLQKQSWSGREIGQIKDIFQERLKDYHVVVTQPSPTECGSKQLVSPFVANR